MYTYQHLKTYCEKVFLAMGCPEADAKIITKVLLQAELHGLSSHGMLRVKDIYGLWKAGRINVTP
ncbi:MAG: Ldh family oxidoreductase, partial [Mucinivorans sp.]